MYQYVVSAQKPTNVTHVLKGNFINARELDLIICKSTRIEFHTLTSEGLLAQFDLGIYGRVATCKLYKPHGEERDLLFVATERRQYFVLSYDTKSGKIVTKAKGEITSRINRPNENGQIGIIDPDCRVIGLNLYQGQFDVIPMDSKGQLKESFNIRLEEINVIDIQFLYGYDLPTICVLYEDNRNSKCTRHIKTYKISVKDMEFKESPWSQPNVDLETNMIIPIPEPIGGVLIMGLETIAYRNGRSGGRSGQAGTTISIPVRCGLVRAFAPIDEDGQRYLLCDEWGGLHVIALQIDRGTSPVPTSSITSSSSSSSSPAMVQTMTVVDLSMEFLGETSIASSIAYLDNGYVFVGSSFGDSQLIRLCPDKDKETDSYIETIQTCTNLGPIVDFCVVDLDRQGQGQVVTCSGAFKDGSLRVVRNGIGIDEQASVELPGIRGMWSLRDSFKSNYDRYLVQTFTSETRVLVIEDEELSETEISGFNPDLATLYCGNMIGNYLVQVTSTEVRIVKCADTSTVHFLWSAPAPKRITVASGNPSQLLIALDGGEIVLFEIEPSGTLTQKGTQVLEHEVACININPFDSKTKDGDKTMTDGSSETTRLCTDVAVIGMWTDVTIRILALPSLEQIHIEKLDGETIPRSLYFVTLEGFDHLLVGLGDGNLYTFDFVRGAEKNHMLTAKKKMTLGSRPISLSEFKSKDSTFIFAGTDRPTVIYSSGHKLLYSNVNQREVTAMVPFNTENFADCLAIASEEDLTIGTINDIQKLHIRSYPLGEQPRRICHQKSSRCFGVCTIRSGTGAFRASASENKSKTRDESAMDVDNRGAVFEEESNLDMIETSFVRLIDDETFKILDSFQLDEFESGCSILCCKFSEDPGTGSTSSQNPASSSSSSSSKSTTDKAQRKEDIEYIVVGTAYAIEGEQEPNKGRILVFKVDDKEESNSTPAASGSAPGRRLNMVAEKQTRGAVYCLNSFNGKLLAGINSKVKLFSFVDKGTDECELQPKCGHHEHILALYIESRGDFIVVGDLMKSISLLVYRSLDDTIEEIARDYNANWMTAVGICDDDTYIGAETHLNLFTVQKNSTAVTEEARHMLNVCGEFHLGEFVNRFHHGSLVMQSAQQQTDMMKTGGTASSTLPKVSDDDQVSETVMGILNSSAKPEMLFCTVNGVIGVIASLTEGQYKLLRRVEKALSCVIQGVGGLSHSAWRSFTNDRKSLPNRTGYIDGDLIEAFLELPDEDVKRVVDMVNGKVPLGVDEDISSILSLNNAVAPAVVASAVGASNGSDLLSLNLDVDSLTRFIEDLARLH
uniref:DNA damage-binding protein 1 n=1 Tax=Mucochytrium quahogii TaxID=96639 RepID=A0A7S2S558_9STRA|mmetsp:Transcript_25052/g.40653  ORF Transcript_25052/g.40653 Transcript_25052/m.40653 type:complete len:1300 (+) Transcript_25052:403-4302(+)|eukprot:CAMPEP_0203754596 /NCGR_PEP_ID=MMETSP0098-20131031/8177_1 /ASSEMBLY_ACC=CAM_ASM_000208 /TAXON_ID=96639 /ORGANISM=" , Strain NY0313808BC1" /LENGTH=1299 /DNA_ID=CAMNT_0050645693 /DNA_START=384 /DNA_END=4283 /DNA_ORIENTATION=-